MGFGRGKIHGESGDAILEGNEPQISHIKERIEQYQASDIWNTEETGLFYCMPRIELSRLNLWLVEKKRKTHDAAGLLKLRWIAEDNT